MKKIKIKKRTKKTNIKSNDKGDLSAFKRRFKKGNLGEKILIIIMLILVSLFILGFAFAIYIVISAPDFDVNNLYTKEASIVYDSENNEKGHKVNLKEMVINDNPFLNNQNHDKSIEDYPVIFKRSFFKKEEVVYLGSIIRNEFI